MAISIPWIPEQNVSYNSQNWIVHQHFGDTFTIITMQQFISGNSPMFDESSRKWKNLPKVSQEIKSSRMPTPCDPTVMSFRSCSLCSASTLASRSFSHSGSHCGGCFRLVGSYFILGWSLRPLWRSCKRNKYSAGWTFGHLSLLSGWFPTSIGRNVFVQFPVTPLESPQNNYA